MKNYENLLFGYINPNRLYRPSMDSIGITILLKDNVNSYIHCLYEDIELQDLALLKELFPEIYPELLYKMAEKLL
jgi:hypothetical protein